MTINTDNQEKQSGVISQTDLWSGLIERATLNTPATSVPESKKRIDGQSFEPTQPYSDILYIFQQYNEKPIYLSVRQQIGRSTPFSLILEALDSDVPSINHNSTFESQIDEIIDLIDSHYETYGSMFVQDIFDVLSDFGHLQSAIFVPSHDNVKPSALLPIMGFSALHFALKRLAYMADNNDTPSNILMLQSATDDESITFTYQHTGFASLGRPTCFHDDIGLQTLSLAPDPSDEIDLYDDELSAVHVSVDMVCPEIGEFAIFKPTISSTPFKFMGYTDTPTMWSSIVNTHYVGNPYYKDVATTALKYQDVAMFWLAATSGLSLNHFSSFKRRNSGFEKLSKDKKIEVLMKIAPMIDHIALSMQSNEYLSKSALLNLYE